MTKRADGYHWQRFIGCAVALTLVNSFSDIHAAEPPPATSGATAQAISPGIGPVLKPGVWTNLTPADAKLKESNRHKFCLGFAIDPQNPATIYLCISGYDLSGGEGLYKTTDGGTTWKRLGSFDSPIHVLIDPKDSNHLYCVDSYPTGQSHSQSFGYRHDVLYFAPGLRTMSQTWRR